MNQSVELSNQLIKVLEYFVGRESMLFGNVDQCEFFFRGLHIGFGFAIDRQRYEQIHTSLARNRGWTWTANSFSLELLEQQLEEKAIMKILLQLEIDTLKEFVRQMSA